MVGITRSKVISFFYPHKKPGEKKTTQNPLEIPSQNLPKPPPRRQDTAILACLRFGAAPRAKHTDFLAAWRSTVGPVGPVGPPKKMQEMAIEIVDLPMENGDFS